MVDKALLFFNPKSGHSDVETQWRVIHNHFLAHGIELHTVFVPLPDDVLKAIIDSAIVNGIALFIAAGGDGTVSLVATHLVGTTHPIGIIPLGTGNLLSKALGIPQALEQALDLITDKKHTVVKIDTLNTNERHYLMNIGVGVSPKIMDAKPNQKQKFGSFAYIVNLIQEVQGLKLHRIKIDVDNKKSTHYASEILLTNIKTAGFDPLIWSEDISLNDGIVDLLVIKTKNPWGFLHLLLSVFNKKVKTNPEVKFIKVNEYCRIETQTPMLAQADGDIIGKTPFEVHVIPSSLNIISGRDYLPMKKERGKNENI